MARRHHFLPPWLSALKNPPRQDPDDATGVDSVQPGQAVHLNYSISHELLDDFRIGIAGYYLRQILDDRIEREEKWLG